MNALRRFYYTYICHKYVLTEQELPLWASIVAKANKGYGEWFHKTKGDDLCGPWIKDINKKEIELIDKIYTKYYGNDWILTMSLSTEQVSYSQYNEIKDKVIFNI